MDKSHLIGQRVCIVDRVDLGLYSEMRKYIGTEKGKREIIFERKTKAGLALIRDAELNSTFPIALKYVEAYNG